MRDAIKFLFGIQLQIKISEKKVDKLLKYMLESKAALITAKRVTRQNKLSEEFVKNLQPISVGV